MLGILIATVVNTAASHNNYVAIITYVEIIIDSFLNTAFTKNNRNMHTFILGAILDADIYTAFTVSFSSNINISCGIPPRLFTINAEIIGSLWYAVQVSHLCQHMHLNIV